MNRKFFIYCCVAILIAGLAIAVFFGLKEAGIAEKDLPASRLPYVSREEKQEGMSYINRLSRYSSPEAILSLRRLTHTGAEWIALIVTQYQDDI